MVDAYLTHGSKLVDITNEFLKACEELETGEFSMSNDFKISHAMSAIEIMDPKMDSGMDSFEWKMLNFTDKAKLTQEDVCLQTGHNVPSYDRTFVSTNLTDAIAKLRKTLRGNNTATEKHEFQALLIRFEFFSSLLEMFDFLLPSKGTLYLLNAGINETEIDPFIPNLYSAGEQLQKCLHFHKRILATINFGKQPPKDERDSLFDWLSTFDSNTYLYMSTAGLPRKLQLFSRLEGYKYIEDTLETIGEIIMSVPDYELVKKFGDLHSNILTRSVLQLILFPLNRHNLTGTIPFMQIAFNSVNRFCGYLMNNNIQDVVAQHNSYFPHLNVLFNEIFGLFERAYTCLYQTHGNNLARQWDFFHVNFDDFSILINEV
uniref:Protein MAK10 homolog n=1 Tax=Meloidogyne javanica TaxID=6303 RepID=A0A915LY19_MELJA